MRRKWKERKEEILNEKEDDGWRIRKYEKEGKKRKKGRRKQEEKKKRRK